MDQIKKRQALEQAIEHLEEAKDLLSGIPGMDATREGLRRNISVVETALYNMDGPYDHPFNREESYAHPFDMVGYANRLLAGCR
jgi:hypothetical protein